MAMSSDQLKKMYGDEYPAVVIHDGVRLTLFHETRFSRHYHSKEHNMGSHVSRFMDSSTSITAVELQREWSAWSDELRFDFCQALCWLYEQSDFPEILRFTMQHAGPKDWTAIAGTVASRLPRDEAFEFLLGALRKSPIGDSSNIIQGIATTKHPKAEATIRRQLKSTWAHRNLWRDDEFVNWVASEATGCIQYLIEFGAPAGEFEEQVRKLSQHVCSHNRDSCRRSLSKYYSWLK